MELRAGTRVKSPAFGEGVVQSMAGDAVARILFDRGGLMTLNIDLAPLELLGGTADPERPLRTPKPSNPALVVKVRAQEFIEVPVPSERGRAATRAAGKENAMETSSKRNGRARLPDFETVKAQLLSGKTSREVAEAYGVKPCAVSACLNYHGTSLKALGLAHGNGGRKASGVGNGQPQRPTRAALDAASGRAPALSGRRKPAVNGSGRPDGIKKLGGVPIEAILADLREQSASLAKAIEVLENLR